MPSSQQSLPLEADPLHLDPIPVEVDRWEEYFLYIATVVSIKSKDPNCSVGAVIVSSDNIVLSTGFNGFARGVHDDPKTLDDVETKLKVICHAENNAIINAARIGGHALKGSTIYVTKFPCLACCNAIIQAGIARIYTHDSEYWKQDPFDKDHSLKKRIFRETHIQVIAPNHPDFNSVAPIMPPKKKRPEPRKAAPSTPATKKTA
jgi:dCMP deaminase